MAFGQIKKGLPHWTAPFASHRLLLLNTVCLRIGLAFLNKRLAACFLALSNVHMRHSRRLNSVIGMRSIRCNAVRGDQYLFGFAVVSLAPVMAGFHCATNIFVLRQDITSHIFFCPVLITQKPAYIYQRMYFSSTVIIRKWLTAHDDYTQVMRYIRPNTN